MERLLAPGPKSNQGTAVHYIYAIDARGSQSNPIRKRCQRRKQCPIVQLYPSTQMRMTMKMLKYVAPYRLLSAAHK